MSVITLTTDFGTRDYYVGTMKGVILGITPEVSIIDLTHEIAKQEIAEAAIVLRSSRPYFPEGTIHVAVVDPGVGGHRRPILLESGGQRFVGPDNGIFSYVIAPGWRAFELTSESLRREAISDTFHGRDVFAPAAAHLARGVDAAEFGPEITDLRRLQTRTASVYPGEVQGEVMHVDSFGNLITNVPAALFEDAVGDSPVTIEISGRRIEGVSRTYSDAARGALVAVFGSTDLLEIAVRDGSAHRRLGVGRGDPVTLFIGG